MSAASGRSAGRSTTPPRRTTRPGTRTRSAGGSAACGSGSGTRRGSARTPTASIGRRGSRCSWTRASPTRRGSVPSAPPGRSCEGNDGVTDKRYVEEGNNMCTPPGGSVYSTADETSGEGTFVADRPAGYLGKWMRGGSFTFRDGRLDRYEVAEGGEHLAKQFTKDKDAGKNRLAGLSIGLNPMLRYGFLQDASVAGAFHLGFGANEEGGGKNKGDFYLGGNLTNATVAVDGKAILRGGRLAV